MEQESDVFRISLSKASKKTIAKGSMGWVWEVVDCKGRRVHLSRKQWSHIQEHPGMSGKMDKVIETLKHPEQRVQLPYDNEAWRYYNYDKEQKEYLCVIVRYLNGTGFIITGFFTKKKP